MESVSNVGVLDKAIGVLHAVERRGPADARRPAGDHRAAAGDAAPARRRPRAPRPVAPRPAGRFCLGLGLVALGHVASETFPIAARRRPRLAELCQQTGESVQLYVRDGERRRCAVSFPSPHGLRWMVGEGALLPLHLGSAGRVLTGELGPDGWVETVEEREPGVASVSAPIPGRRPACSPPSASADRSSGSRASLASASAPTSSRPRSDMPTAALTPSHRLRPYSEGVDRHAADDRVDVLPSDWREQVRALADSATPSSWRTTTSSPRSRTSPTTSATRSGCPASPPLPMPRRSCSAASTSWPRRRRSWRTTRRC